MGTGVGRGVVFPAVPDEGVADDGALGGRAEGATVVGTEAVVGRAVGLALGNTVGALEGRADGTNVGLFVGAIVGDADDGESVGLPGVGVGPLVGTLVGTAVGLLVGTLVGIAVGEDLAEVQVADEVLPGPVDAHAELEQLLAHAVPERQP